MSYFCDVSAKRARTTSKEEVPSGAALLGVLYLVCCHAVSCLGGWKLTKVEKDKMKLQFAVDAINGTDPFQIEVRSGGHIVLARAAYC